MGPNDTRPLELTSRFEEALVYASQLHSRQARKGTRIPYIAHLLAVTALVLEDGGDEDQAIAALLHDAVEDQGGLETLREIRARFGDRVAQIVKACSDTYMDPKPAWESRKRAYIEHLRQVPADVRRVSLADKLHNARALLATLKQEGEATWERFRGGKEGTLWYYRALADVFKATGSDGMAAEFESVVSQVEALAACRGARP